MRTRTYQLLLIILLITSAFLCRKGPRKDKVFRLISASSQQSFGGVAGSGSGTEYRLRLIATKNLNLSADSVYAEGKVSLYSIRVNGKIAESPYTVKKGDSLEIRAQFRTASIYGGPDNPQMIEGSPRGYFPLSSTAALIWVYRSGKESKRYILLTNKDIEKTEPILGE